MVERKEGALEGLTPEVLVGERLVEALDDPVGLRRQTPYAYAGDDPINNSDLTGLSDWGVLSLLCEVGGFQTRPFILPGSN